MKLISIVIFLFVIFVLVIGLVISYVYIIQNKSSNFKDVSPYQEYLLDPVEYNSFYFNNSLYSIPGSTADPYMLYGAGYMPYESAVPAVDVMRTGDKKNLPSYYKQYLKQNTTPFAIRNY
jgi:hypothetical protein